MTRIRLLMVIAVLSLGMTAASSGVAARAGAPPKADRAPLVAPGCALPAGSPSAAAALAACTTDQADLHMKADSFPAGTDACVGVPLVDDRCESWVFRRDAPGIGDAAGVGLDGAGMMVVSPDSRTVFTFGWEDTMPDASSQIDALLIASDAASGDVRYTERFAGSAIFDQAVPRAVAISPDGAVVYSLVQELTKSLSVDDGCTQTLVAFDAGNGSVRWIARERGPDGFCADPKDLAVDPTGARVYVVGRATHAEGARIGLVTAYETADPDRIGQQAWQQVIDGPDGVAVASAIAPSPDGSRVYVAGNTKEDLPLRQYQVGENALFGYAASDGDLVVQGTSPVRGNAPAGVGVTPDGKTAFVVSGGIVPNGAPTFDIVTTAFDTATGTPRWQANYDGPRAQIKSSFDSVWHHGPLAVSPDGKSVFVAGYSTCLHGANLCSDFVTLGYDAATGAPRWAPVRYSSEMDMSWLPQIAIHPNGRTVYTVGDSRTAAVTKNARVTTIAYDTANGAQRWVGRHTDGQSFFGATAIAPDGSLLFTGGATSDLADDNTQPTYDAFLVGYGA